MSVQITIDQASFDNFNKQMDSLKKEGNRSLYSALIKVAMRIKNTAQLRLTGRKHVVTSRLKNSLFLKVSKPIANNPQQYSDLTGKTYDADLQSVSVSDTEVAVGTNVEYAGKIEYMDSFLQWGIQNADVSKAMAEEMRNEMKFGPGVAPQKTKK